MRNSCNLKHVNKYYWRLICIIEIFQSFIINTYIKKKETLFKCTNIFYTLYAWFLLILSSIGPISCFRQKKKKYKVYDSQTYPVKMLTFFLPVQPGFGTSAFTMQMWENLGSKEDTLDDTPHKLIYSLIQ